jgi:hypothetical protein
VSEPAELIPDHPPAHSSVKIHYRRIPDLEQIYDQRVVAERADVVITLSEPLDLPALIMHDGHVMLEAGSLALWFTYAGAWHDIGRFHRADGSFTGIYANILTPVRMEGADWYTTDLFLDVWWPWGGEVTLLDEDEFDASIRRSQIEPDVARRAREEADRLPDLAEVGDWPPPVVAEWTLERALEVLGR